MATNTKNYNFKKPDESDFYDIQDQNGNWDIADEKMEELSAPTFEDYSGTTSVPEASTAIEAIKSKKKIPEILANIKAAFKGVCLLGHIVNNCVTDNAKLPLSAAQGKALMDQITKLNSDLKKRVYTIPVSNISDSNGNATLGVSTKDGILIALDITSPDYVSYQPTVVQQEWYIRCYKNTDVYSAYVGLISGKAYFLKLS